MQYTLYITHVYTLLHVYHMRIYTATVTWLGSIVHVYTISWFTYRPRMNVLLLLCSTNSWTSMATKSSTKAALLIFKFVSINSLGSSLTSSHHYTSSFMFMMSPLSSTLPRGSWQYLPPSILFHFLPAFLVSYRQFLSAVVVHGQCFVAWNIYFLHDI